MFVHKLQKLLSAFEVPASFFAALTWPKFSLSALLIATRLKRHGIEPSTIIDAGANQGQFALAMAHVYPNATIHSFEPDPDIFALLQKNVRAYPRVQTHEVALGDKREQRPFQACADDQVSSFLPVSEERLRAFPDTRTRRTLTVDVDTLGQFFATRELVPPVLLKLDVQGYEHLVVEGARAILPQIDHVLTETAVRPLYVGEIPCGEMIAMLARYGFELDLVADLHHSPAQGTIIEFDLLFSRHVIDRREA